MLIWAIVQATPLGLRSVGGRKENTAQYRVTEGVPQGVTCGDHQAEARSWGREQRHLAQHAQSITAGCGWSRTQAGCSQSHRRFVSNGMWGTHASRRAEE